MIAFLNWLDGVLWGVPLIALMILTGLYFTVRSGFFQFRHFGWIKLIKPIFFLYAEFRNQDKKLYSHLHDNLRFLKFL